MLEQKKPLMLGKNRGEPMRACVHGEQDLGLQGIRLQDPPPPVLVGGTKATGTHGSPRQR